MRMKWLTCKPPTPSQSWTKIKITTKEPKSVTKTNWMHQISSIRETFSFRRTHQLKRLISHLAAWTTKRNKRNQLSLSKQQSVYRTIENLQTQSSFRQTNPLPLYSCSRKTRRGLSTTSWSTSERKKKYSMRSFTSSNRNLKQWSLLKPHTNSSKILECLILLGAKTVQRSRRIFNPLLLRIEEPKHSRNSSKCYS